MAVIRSSDTDARVMTRARPARAEVGPPDLEGSAVRETVPPRRDWARI